MRTTTPYTVCDAAQNVVARAHFEGDTWFAGCFVCDEARWVIDRESAVRWCRSHRDRHALSIGAKQ